MGAACDGDDDATTSTQGVSGTVALGEIPEPLSDRPEPSVPPNLVADGTTTTTTTEPEVVPIDGPIGEVADGDRLLIIGDRVLASTAPRFGGIACDVLPGFGWTVEIAAEPGRFIEFGDEVLDELLDPAAGDDWDVVVVMLGNLFDGDLAGFEDDLTGLVERISPRPMIVFTLTEVDDEAELNDLIRALPDEYPNVVVIDWAELSAAEPDVLLEDGGPLVTEEGSGRLVLFMAAALGDAPGFGEGECLDPTFTDDSAIVL